MKTHQMKLIFEDWRSFLAEAENEHARLPSAGKYKITMPKAEIFKIFMETIENNLNRLKRVADDPQKLADELTIIFEPEKLNLEFEVSEEHFDDLGDGGFAHGGVSGPTVGPKGELPTVTMYLNKYTGETIKNWNDEMTVSGTGYMSDRSATGRQIMAFSARGTVVHEFVHQAQAQDKDINPESGTEEEWKRLEDLVGFSSDDPKFGVHMMKYINRQTSQKFLDDPNKTKKDKEIRDIVNKVYYSNETELTGWAQGVPSDLIDMSQRGKLEGLESLEGNALKQAILNIFDNLIKNAAQGPPEEIARESGAIRFYGHPEGFMSTYGLPGYKAFLQLAKGYAEKYPENMYR